jgi:predicted outer membrane repeat protein
MTIGGCVLGLALPLCATAATLIPTRFDDPVPDGCLPDDCSLREAVILANATPGPDAIVLAVGDYQVTLAGASEEFAYTGDLDVTDPLEINGAGRDLTSIVAVGLGDRVLDETDAPLTLRNLTVSGGNHSFTGGGIRTLVGLTIEDGRVSDNTTSSSGGGLWVWRNLTLVRTEITGNTSPIGGGLYVAFTPSPPANLSFADVMVTANQGTGMTLTGPLQATLVRTDVRANQGHGMDVAVTGSSSITLVGGSLEANQGAGMFVDPVSVGPWSVRVAIDRTLVQDNMAWGLYASALARFMVGDTLQVTVKDAVFRRNRVAAYVETQSLDSWLRFDRTLFADNAASEGAALHLHGPAFVYRSRFEGNHSTGEGGAVFVGNSAAGPAPMFNRGPGYLVVRDSSFSANGSGGDGGAIYVATTLDDDPDEPATDVLATSGRALASSTTPYALEAISTSFTGNTAAENGGAAAVVTRDARLHLVTFSGNQAGPLYVGGGLHVGNASVSVSESTFRGNTVQSGGAGTALAFSAQGGQGQLTLGHTIVSGTCATLLPPTDLGYNLESPAAGCFPAPATGTQVNVSEAALALGPLTAGTWTSFHEPQAGSVAIDAGGTCGPTDQRGFRRVDGLCDVGAIEAGALDDVLFRDGFE